MKESRFWGLLGERPWLWGLAASENGRYNGLVHFPTLDIKIRDINRNDFSGPVLSLVARNRGVKQLQYRCTVWARVRGSVFTKELGLFQVRPKTRRGVKGVIASDLDDFAREYMAWVDELAISVETFSRTPAYMGWARQSHLITVLRPHKGIRIRKFLASLRQ